MGRAVLPGMSRYNFETWRMLQRVRGLFAVQDGIIQV